MIDIDVNGVTHEVARGLADEIKHLRTGLDNEDKQAAGVELRHHARAKKWRDQDRAKIQGMVIALSFLLGRPNDVQLAEEFIEDSPVWRAL
jgi:hypothetical protein